MYTNTLYTIFGLVASASAHVVMTTPKGWTVDNSPLDKSGSDFPCKGVAYDSSVAANVMNKGESQPMKFMGSAVHGGGSCQVSLTTDLEPTKDSVWKVIKSIEGGCPAQGVDGNYPENANLDIPFDYDFEIPDDVPAGKYTLAWTWFNNVGNREMYMNCAPAEAVGSGGDESSFNALPDMFVANVGNGCSTVEGSDLEFPNAGQVVQRLGDKTLGGPTGDCQSGGSSGGESGGDYGSGDGDEAGGEAGGESGGETGDDYEFGNGDEAEAPSESAPASPVESLPGAIQAPIEPTSEPAAPVETEPASTPEPEAPAETTPVADEQPVEDEQPDLPETEVPANNSEQDGSDSESGSGSDNGSGSGGYAVGTECTNGTWNCIGGNSFQRCGSGTWSAVQQLSAGTECTAGEGESIQMTRKRGTTRFGAKFLL